MQLLSLIVWESTLQSFKPGFYHHPKLLVTCSQLRNIFKLLSLLQFYMFLIISILGLGGLMFTLSLLFSICDGKKKEKLVLTLKISFQPAYSVQSTCTLVKIYINNFSTSTKLSRPVIETVLNQSCTNLFFWLCFGCVTLH